MATSRTAADDITTEVRRIVGQTDSNLSDSLPNTRIIDILNRFVHSIPHRVIDLRATHEAHLSFPMWHTTWSSTASSGAGNLLIAAGSSTIDFPDNLDHMESLYDTTYMREVEIVKNLDGRYSLGRKLREKTKGPAEAVELTGMATSNSVWVMQGTLWPSTPAGFTPTFRLKGYRKPAILTSQSSPSSSEYLDIDVEYEEMVIHGTVAEIMLPDDAMSQIYRSEAEKVLSQLAKSAVVF